GHGQQDPRAAALSCALASAHRGGPGGDRGHALGLSREAGEGDLRGAGRMTAVVFYFQVHQPFRLRRYTFFDIGVHDGYFDDAENARIVRRVAAKCYQPMNEVILKLVKRHQGRFRCAYSVSGAALEQMELWAPESLSSFQRLADTG